MFRKRQTLIFEVMDVCGCGELGSEIFAHMRRLTKRLNQSLGSALRLLELNFPF